MSLLYIIGQHAARLSTSSPAPSGPEVIGDIINDSFSGSALSADWTVPGSQTVTVSGGKARLQGGLTTKNVALAIKNSGYGHSMLRNYTIETTFKVETTPGIHSYGVKVGVFSTNQTSFHPAAWGIVDFVAGTLELNASGSSNELILLNSDPLSLSINTTDTYLLRLTKLEGNIQLYLQNTNSLEDQTIDFDYGFGVGLADPNMPNIFYYSFGVLGDTDASFHYYKASTTEKKNIKMLFLGDSITAGYLSGATNGYPYLLMDNVDGVVQVMAGGGNSPVHIADCLPEILMVNPEIAVLNIGTNTPDFATLQSTVIALNDAGIQTLVLLVVNGNNPATTDTFNNQIKNRWPADYADTWTDGYNTMSVGNGEMGDELHPSPTGNVKQANLLKTLKPLLFPL